MLQSNPSTPAQTSVSAQHDVDILLIGHVCRDLTTEDPEGPYRLGGTVSFAAITALQLGRKPAILTRAAAGLDLTELPSAVDLHILPSPTTTTFANVYTSAGRIQHCYTPALPIKATDVPVHLQLPKAVLLGPLVGEVEPDVASLFQDPVLTAAVPQGWMRQWDANGKVSSKPWESAEAILPHLDVLVLSLEDIDYDMSRLERFIEVVPLVALTEYREGSTIYRRELNGQVSTVKIPPRPAQEVDPTGAGDTFATAFLIRLQETGDPIQSARFANVTASFGVEKEGVAGIPNRAQVLAYMEEHPFDRV